MRKELTALRQKMKNHNFDAYMITSSDFHQSEYVHDHFKGRAYVSGFTGSAGTLIVTADEAYLWTDGRYFLQAARQLDSSGIGLMKIGQPGVPTISEYLRQTLSDHQTLAFDGRTCAIADVPAGSFKLSPNVDLLDEIWPDRPAIVPSQIYPLADSVTGESSQSKLARLRSHMAEQNADYCISASLEEIAWLYNLRGNDVKHTPVFFSYALIAPDEDRLYVMDSSCKGSHFCKSTHIHSYEQFMEDLNLLPAGRVLINKDTAGYAIINALPENIEVVSDNYIAVMKSVKNPVEIQCTKNAHKKDGAAMVEFLCYLKKNIVLKENIGKTGITEISAAEKLKEFRRKQKGFNDLSFDTISAYGSNGAIIHYSATEDTNKELKPEGLYLVDSGGQYDDGTTDITRTIALGPLTEEMKLHYTAVLKCHIALCTAVFEPGTTGKELDAKAREPLHKIGLDYNHGTGHGVGHLLGCHEGPQSISPRNDKFPIIPGTINSDEPGVYIESSHGIRLENEILCVELPDGKYGFEPITFCPFDRTAILAEDLTADELSWLNDYHRSVYDIISPLVSENTRRWLMVACEEITAATPG